MATLFISDLHLEPGRPEIGEQSGAVTMPRQLFRLDLGFALQALQGPKAGGGEAGGQLAERGSLRVGSPGKQLYQAVLKKRLRKMTWIKSLSTIVECPGGF